MNTLRPQSLLRLAATGVLLALALFAAQPSSAQISGPVQWKPPITAGHCTMWLKPGVAEDSGVSGCGSGGSALPTCALGQMVYYAANGSVGSCLSVGTNLSITSGTLNASGGGGSGTVTSVSVATANGFSGTVANPTTTPVITLNLSLTGDCSFSAGAITCTKTNGTAFGTFATQNYATPPAIGGTTPNSGAFTTVSASGQITSTVATGTAPFSVASTTQVANLNAASVGGYTLPCTVPSIASASGEYLTNNGSTCSWASVAGSGTINAAAQYATPYYSASGSATTLSGLASPTSGAGYYALRYDPTSATAVALTADQVGGIARSISGATSTDTAAYSDVLGLVVHDAAGSASVTETLPTPTTLGNAHFAYNYCNNSTHTDSITPTTWTIALNNGSAGSSISVGSGVCVQVSVDPFNSTQWDAFTYGASSSGGSPGGSTNAVQTNNGSGGFNGISLGAGTILQGNSGAPTATATPTLGVAGTTAGTLALANTAGGVDTIAAGTNSGNESFTLPSGSGGTFALSNVSQNISGTYTFSAGIVSSKSGAASNSPISATGSIFTGGTGTTTFPYDLFQPSAATAVTTWSTAGTFHGDNAASGFTGNFIDEHLNGGASVFSVNYQGNAVVNNLTVNGTCTGCGSSGTGLSGMTAGQVPIAATATTVTSSEALAGAGTGIVTGPTTSVSGDVVTYTGTAGQTQDSGTPLSSVTKTIASGTATLGTSAIASGACATVVTVSATGVATTDVVKAGFNSDPTSVTGYGVSATGAVLTIYPYPTANNVSFKVCNSTGSSITPGAMTLNWSVTR